MAVLPISQKGKERENRTGIYFPPRLWLLTHISATFHMALPPSAQLQAEGIRLLQCRACPSNASWTPVDLTLSVFSRNHSFLFLCLSISLCVAYPPWLMKVPNSSPPFTASFKDTPLPTAIQVLLLFMPTVPGAVFPGFSIPSPDLYFRPTPNPVLSKGCQLIQEHQRETYFTDES